MNITVVGTGYVGLVTGACFAEMGNNVTCVDIDEAKIARLKAGQIPIYEPGLEKIVVESVERGLLDFTTDLPSAMKKSNVYFIAVGTPPGEDGSADLRYVLAVAKSIGENLEHYAVIVDKSTVPVGTGDKVRNTIQQALDAKSQSSQGFDVVSNPEFLKEGAAVKDFMTPDRIIIGAESEKAKSMMTELYAPFNRSRDKVLMMGVRDAEMTKYVANAMLATKISLMNEVANICDRLGADVEAVRKGIGSDSRIGPSFIYPGCGYGGSCFPKDVKALIRTADEVDFDAMLLKSVDDRNQLQKKVLFQKASTYFDGDIAGKTFALWGLAFKPDTDDVREAAAITLIEDLIEAGAKIKAYDPEANESIKEALPAEWFESSITISEDPYEILKGSDALVLVTEWKRFRQPDFEQIKFLLNTPFILDGRNLYNPKVVREYGFDYMSIGRP